MRGYQKKVIFLKNTGSHLFDEAYFVVSPNGAAAKKDDMVIEANRIIEESIGAKDKEKKAFAPGFLYPFLIGAATSFLVLSAVLFIFTLI